MQPEDILFLLRLHIRVLTATNRRISQLNQVRLRRSIRIRENLDPQPGYWEAFPWDPVPPNREVTGYELTLQTGDGPANLALDHQLWLPRVIRFPHVPHFVGRLASAVVHRAQHVFDRVRGRPPAPPPELPDHVVEERLGGVVDALRAHPPRNFWDNQLPEGGVMPQLGLVPGEHPVVQLGLRYVCFDALMRAGRVHAMARVVDRMVHRNDVQVFFLRVDPHAGGGGLIPLNNPENIEVVDVNPVPFARPAFNFPIPENIYVYNNRPPNLEDYSHPYQITAGFHKVTTGGTFLGWDIGVEFGRRGALQPKIMCGPRIEFLSSLSSRNKPGFGFHQGGRMCFSHRFNQPTLSVETGRVDGVRYVSANVGLKTDLEINDWVSLPRETSISVSMDKSADIPWEKAEYSLNTCLGDYNANLHPLKFRWALRHVQRLFPKSSDTSMDIQEKGDLDYVTVDGFTLDVLPSVNNLTNTMGSAEALAEIMPVEVKPTIIEIVLSTAFLLQIANTGLCVLGVFGAGGFYLVIARLNLQAKHALQKSLTLLALRVSFMFCLPSLVICLSSKCILIVSRGSLDLRKMIFTPIFRQAEHILLPDLSPKWDLVGGRLKVATQTLTWCALLKGFIELQGKTSVARALVSFFFGGVIIVVANSTIYGWIDSRNDS